MLKPKLTNGEIAAIQALESARRALDESGNQKLSGSDGVYAKINVALYDAACALLGEARAHALLDDLLNTGDHVETCLARLNVPQKLHAVVFSGECSEHIDSVHPTPEAAAARMREFLPNPRVYVTEVDYIVDDSFMDGFNVGQIANDVYLTAGAMGLRHRPLPYSRRAARVPRRHRGHVMRIWAVAVLCAAVFALFFALSFFLTAPNRASAPADPVRPVAMVVTDPPCYTNYALTCTTAQYQSLAERNCEQARAQGDGCRITTGVADNGVHLPPHAETVPTDTQLDQAHTDTTQRVSDFCARALKLGWTCGQSVTSP